MKLGEFIESFIAHNTLIRLLHEESSGYKLLNEHKSDWNSVSMEWEVLKQRGLNRHYIGNEVIGITDIVTVGRYPEAVNIVIEELENQPFVEEALNDSILYSN